MNYFSDAIVWIFSSQHSDEANTVAFDVGTHALISFVSLLVAAVIAIPVGYAIGHSGRGKQFAVAFSGAARALPSLGLLTILTLALGFSRGSVAAVIVLLLLGVPSILAGAYSGLEAIDRRTVDAARAMGMTEWQILVKVEIPLGLPLLIGGLRSAALQIIATATLAAYVGLGGLGDYLLKGLATRDYAQLIGGAILVAALALVTDGVFAIAQRIVAPRGVPSTSNKRVRSRSSRSRAAAESSAT